MNMTMHQIIRDKLLKIHSDHIITCPIIDTLIFQGEKCTRIFKINIDQDPNLLTIDSTKLLEAMGGLQKWTKELIEVYNNLSNEDKEKTSDLEIDAMIENIEELLGDNYLVKKEEIKINDLIEKWKIEAIKYNEIKQSIIDLELSKLSSKELLKATSIDNPQYLDYMIKHNQIKAEIKESENTLLEIEYSFDDTIKTPLEYEIVRYSKGLEETRRMNDDLREETNELRKCIIKHYKEELDCYQPDEYLVKKFGITDALADKKILNLGLIYNNYSTFDHEIEKGNQNGLKYFYRLLSDLKDRAIISDEDRLELEDLVTQFRKEDDYLSQFNFSKDNIKTFEFEKEALFSKIKDKGYDIIRYYEQEDDFLKNKDSFKVQELNSFKQELKNKQNQKIKP